jgi:hypothetical protein
MAKSTPLIFPIPRNKSSRKAFFGFPCVFNSLVTEPSYPILHEGLYRYKRMPFGLVNAPATFQQCVDLILISVKWKQALVYLDDVIIFIPTLTGHHGHVSKALRLLINAGVSLKLSKFHIFQPSVDYLGHVVHPEKLSVASNNVESIARAEHPRSRTELRSFLGM